MDKESKAASAVQSSEHKQHRRQRKEPAGGASSPSLILPNPYEPERSLRGRSGVSPKHNPSKTNGVSVGKGDRQKRHGFSSNRHVREVGFILKARENEQTLRGKLMVFDLSPQTPKSSNDHPAPGTVTSRSSLDTQTKGFRGARSAPNSAGKSRPASFVPFEVKMTDFPELAGVPLAKAGPPLGQRACWGPAPPPLSPPTQTSALLATSGRKASPTQPDPQQKGPIARQVSPAAGQKVVTSWANVASQPPKKPVPKEKTISSNHVQTEESLEQQEDGTTAKKKRKKKKKKAKGSSENAEAESEGPAICQAPPKFEDEEEFPGLTLALTRIDRLMTSSSAAKLCNEENQREAVQHQSTDPTKEKAPSAKTPSAEMTKKGQKAEKVSGKKSKVPVQLDIGNMLAALEKKQQCQKAKQDTKPVILSVGGGLPVVQKQPLAQKKPPWQQDKIAHNPLDSTSPLVKKGKQREVPRAKKPTPLKKVILKEREERKQRRLLEERGLLPENEIQPVDNAAEEEQCDTNATDEVGTSTEELHDQSELNGTNMTMKDGDEEADVDQTIEPQTTSPVPSPADRPKIHSRKFRDYCSQMLSKDVDECVTTLLKELVRFQDRLYQKDPMKARMKRRLVMGLREVLKHLKLRKVKCVVISPNCERIQSKGGLDEALYTIIDTCREQGVPFVFALSRKALGRCVNKAVPVSLVGIFNYDGAQDVYHKMIELSSEARRAYEVMVLSLEQTDQAEEEAELAGNTEEELQIGSLTEEAEPSPDATQPEEPEYIKIWKKMLEKGCNHTFLNFEEQLGSMHLESECTENTVEDERS